MALDVDSLLEPVSEDSPSGESIEYDPAMVEIETLSRGVEMEKDAEGRVIREAEEPDWREVEKLALELAGRAKDLKLALYLLRADLAQNGLPGLRDGLALIAGYLTRYWDSVHPQLDPEDDNDPSARVNAVVGLTHIETVLRSVRLAPLTASRQFGRISYRQYAIAHGIIAMPSARDQEERLPDSSTIEAAFADSSEEFLTQIQTALAEARTSIDEITGAFDNALGYGVAPDLGPLASLIGEIKSLVDRQVAIRGGAEIPPDEHAAGAGPFTGGGGPAGAGVSAGSGVIRGRTDVALLIDKICRYYADNEPSSPVPLILQRVKRLVTMDFMEIIKELTPDGVDQFRVISGIKEPEEDE